MKFSSMTALNRHNPLLWLGLLLLAWLVLGVQLAAPKPASGPFYAATEHHLGVTRWEAAPRLGLDVWTTKSASGDTVCAKATGKDYVDILPPEAKKHILYGDKPGSGGHMWPGQPGKTVSLRVDRQIK